MKNILIAFFALSSFCVSAQETQNSNRNQLTQRGSKNGGKENRLMEEFKDLKLSEKQHNQLKAYFEIERNKMSQNRQRFGKEGEMPSASEMKEMREQMQTKMQEMDAKVKTILTEEQYGKWKAKVNERMQQFMGR